MGQWVKKKAYVLEAFFKEADEEGEPINYGSVSEKYYAYSIDEIEKVKQEIDDWYGGEIDYIDVSDEMEEVEVLDISPGEKENADKMLRSIGLSLPKENTIISYDDSIAYTLDNVKYGADKEQEANLMSEPKVQGDKLNDRPVVRINWSEHMDPRLSEGTEMSILEANELFKELDESALGDARYYKTSFAIEYSYEGVLHTYEGRYDIGDGDGYLLNHISVEADDLINNYSAHENDKLRPQIENNEEIVSQWEYVGYTLVPYLRMHESIESLERSVRLMRSRLYYAIDNPEVVMFRKDGGEPFTLEELNINRDYYDSLMIHIHLARQELNKGRDIPQELPEHPEPFITQSNEVSSSIVNLKLAEQIGDFYWNNDRDNYENMLDENRMDRFDHIIRIQLDLDQGNHYKYIQELEKLTYTVDEREELMYSLKSEQMDYLDKQEKLLSSINHIEYDDSGRLHFFIKAFDGHELDGTYIIKNSYSNEDVKRLDSIFQGNLHQEITTYWNKIEQRLTGYVNAEVDIEGRKCHIVDRWVDKNGVSYAVGYDIEDNQWYYGQAEFDGKTIDFTFDDHRPARDVFERDYNVYVNDRQSARIVKLTGLPVSDEMTDVLERLSQKEYVPLEEINSTKEVKLAHSNVNYSTPTIDLEGREELQAKIVDKLNQFGSIELDENRKAIVDKEGNVLYNGRVEKNSRLDIVIGLPGSGKSSVIVNSLSSEFHSKVIDSDEAKKEIPQFNNGWGASVVHEESQKIADDVFLRSILNHENIVFPRVGSNSDKLIDNIIKLAKQQGYQVNLHYVYLERNMAMGRMLSRFISDGRFLDPKLIDKYDNDIDGNRVAQSYETLKDNRDYIDGYSKWDNGVNVGEKPILVESYNLHGSYIDDARVIMEGDVENEHEKRAEKREIDGYNGHIREGRQSVIQDVQSDRPGKSEEYDNFGTGTGNRQILQVGAHSPTDKQISYAKRISKTLNISLPEDYTKTAYRNFISENQERFSLISSNRVHFTDEQIERANNVDIMSYARSAGLELKREGRDYKAANYHGGLTITPQKNNWHLFAEDKGGGVVQLCMLLENKTWQEAIASLINEDMQPVQYVPPVQEEPPKEFILPERNNTTKHVYAYLTKTRGIEPDIVREMLDGGYIYENTYAACVFVGKDTEGVPRHASVRSTNTEGRVYKRDVPGSQKRYSFSITGSTDTLYVFEAPVDLLSYMSFQRLAGIDTNASYVALGGVSDRALERYLADNPGIKRIVVCTDGDEAGEKGYSRIAEKYGDDYDIARHRPQGKDFNEDLVAYRNMNPQEKSQNISMFQGLQLSEAFNNSDPETIVHSINNNVKEKLPNKEYTNFVNNHKAFISQKHTTRTPLVINAFGGPGVGKSVSCMDICQQLKKLGYNAEYVQEYAKELVYDNNMEMLDGTAKHQFEMLKEQLARMDRLYGNVDFIVTDSPLLLNGVYNKELTPEYDQMIADLQAHFENFTYFVERDESSFQQEGRIHDLEQSKRIDADIKDLLTDKHIFFGTYGHDAINKVVANSIVTFNRINNISEPATQKQINFAKEIASRLSVELPEDNSKAAYRAFISEYQEAFRKGSQVLNDEAVNEKSFAEQVDEVLSGKDNRYDNSVKLCDTPSIFEEIGLDKLPMLYSKKHLRDAVRDKGNNSHKHGLDVEQIINIPEYLSKPIAIFDSISSKPNNSVVALIDMLDKDNAPILVSIYPNGKGTYELNTIDSNYITSIYGKDNGFENYFSRVINSDKLLYIDKYKSQDLFSVLGLQLPKGFNNLDFNKIIHPSNNIVKKNQQNIAEKSSSTNMTDSASEAATTQTSYEEYLADIRKGGKDVRKLLKEAPEKYLTDELYMTAIESWGALIKEVPADKITEAMCIVAVRQYGMNLKSIPEEMKTEAVCVEAYITSNGRSQRYTPQDIKIGVKEKAVQLLEKSNTAFTDVRENVDASAIQEQGEKWLNEINQKLAEYEQDPAAMSELAEWAGRFYNYSVHNIQLLRNQNQGISYVASASAFEKMGYHIKPDEQAMIARVPLFGHFVLDDKGERIYSRNYTAEIKKSIKEGTLKEQRVLRGFQFVSAFYDISQTDCPVSDYPEIFNMGIPSELHGHAFDAMKEFAEGLGFKVMVTDMKSITLRGLCEPDNKIIRINDRLQQTMALSTLCHEIAHGILHTSANASKMTTAQKECEADVMDIMLESSLGLPISDARREHLKRSYDAYKLEQAGKDRPYEVTLQKLIDRVQTKLFRPHIESINNCLAKYMPNKMEMMAQRLISSYALIDAVYDYGNDSIIAEYPDVFDEGKQEDYERLYKKYVDEARLQNSFLPKIGVLQRNKEGTYELYAVHLSSENKVHDLFDNKEAFVSETKALSIMPGMILACKRDVMIDSDLYLVTNDGYEKIDIQDIKTERMENKIAVGLDIRKEYACLNEIYEIGGSLSDNMKTRYEHLAKQLNINNKLSSAHMLMERLQLAVEGLSPGKSELVMEYVFRTGNIKRAEEYAKNWNSDTARDIINEMHVVDVYKYVLWTVETYENSHDVSHDKRLTTGAYNDAAIPSLSDNVKGVIQIWKAYEQILKYSADNKYYAIDKTADGYRIACVELRDYIPEVVYLPDVYESYREAEVFYERELSDGTTSIINDSSKLIELEGKATLHLSTDYLIYDVVKAEAIKSDIISAEEFVESLRNSLEAGTEIEKLFEGTEMLDKLREAQAIPQRLCYIDYREDAIALFISDIAGNIYERIYENENALTAINKVDSSDYKICTDYDEFLARTDNNRYHLRYTERPQDNDLYVEVCRSDGMLKDGTLYSIHDFAGKMSDLQTEGKAGIVEYKLYVKNDRGRHDIIISEAELQNEKPVFEQLYMKLMERNDAEQNDADRICKGVVKQFCNDIITGLDNGIIKQYITDLPRNEAATGDDRNQSEMFSAALDYKAELNDFIQSLDISPADAELMRLDPAIVNKRMIRDPQMLKPDNMLIRNKPIKQEVKIDMV